MNTAISKVKMMIGTMGGADYAIVDNKSGMNLGVKPVVETGLPIQPTLHLGVRIRAAADGSQSMVDVGEISKVVFPEIEFEKHDESRASLFYGKSGPIPEMPNASTFVKVLEDGGFFDEIDDKIGKIMAGHYHDMKKKELLVWVKAQFVEKFQMMFDGKVSDAIDGESTKLPKDGKVIPFMTPEDDSKPTKH